MENAKDLSPKKISKLMDELAVIHSSQEIANQFGKDQLQAVIDVYATSRKELIDRKEVEDDGFAIERINVQLSMINLETTKINKAISIINNNAKNAKKSSNNQPVDVVPKNLKKEQDKLVRQIIESRTIPDIIDNFNIEQLEIAKQIFGSERKAVIENTSTKNPTLTEAQKNDTLRILNNQISRVNKAITAIQRNLQKTVKKDSDSVSNPELSYRFLRLFVEIAEQELDEELFFEIKNKALYLTQEEKSSKENS